MDKALAENKMMATVLDADDKVKASMEVARAQKLRPMTRIACASSQAWLSSN
ncbi:hypothetical protein LP420_04235 [Massilia sp. B-10]|nr:hypothetical protein LP420_04235 [Massilia sp. B-10]